eukprot:UN10144
MEILVNIDNEFLLQIQQDTSKFKIFDIAWLTHHEYRHTIQNTLPIHNNNNDISDTTSIITTTTSGVVLLLIINNNIRSE